MFASEIKIGLIREGKNPPDNRVAFTPEQCRWISRQYPGITMVVQPSVHRCYTEAEYRQAGIAVREDLGDCNILMGIKEVPVDQLIPGKTYLIFSHTKKQQPYNQKLMQALVKNRNTLVDYECLTHDDGQRILGFGFFAGVVGAHNGLKAYGLKTGLFTLPPVYRSKNLNELIYHYFGLRLPNIRIAVTGSGRVTTGIIEIMNLLGVKEIEPEEFPERSFQYPVYTQLKGGSLYERKAGGGYHREEFHLQPELYRCRFRPFLNSTDILMNGIYWEEGVPPLFTRDDLRSRDFGIRVIADITCDKEGSVPCNLGASTIEEPVYGVDKISLQKCLPYLEGTVDMMTVDNLPNELPRDASKYFGEQLVKYVLEDLVNGNSPVIRRATILRDGRLTPPFGYLKQYAGEGD